MSAFNLPTPAANEDDETRIRLFGRQRQEVVPVAGDQHQTAFAGVVEHSDRWLEPLGPPEVRLPPSLHAAALGRLRQGRHGRGRISQFGTRLASYQRIDFCSMVLIIGQAFVNLSPGQVWKAPHNVIDAGTVDESNRQRRAPRSECPPQSCCPRGHRSD